MAKVKYIDHRPMMFIIKSRSGGVSPKEGDIIEVNEDEKRSLLKMKNGKTPMFEEVSTRRAKQETENDLGGN